MLDRRSPPLVATLVRLDAYLLAVPRRVQYLAIGVTLLVMLAVAIPNVPRQYLDYSRTPLLSALSHLQRYETYGTDTIADMYESRVILNNPSDMYTKELVAQTPLEAETWSKEASSPYPPVVLLTEAGLYAIGESIGIGFYGMILVLAALFVGLSAHYFLQTRWYLFPVLYLNFSYFGHRFVYVQDGSYLVMLVVVMAALILARSRREGAHALMAVATTMKLSPAYYVKNLRQMEKATAALYVVILAGGLVLPYFLLDNYAYIYRFNSDIKGEWYETAGAVLLVVPFAAMLWYVETRRGFDMEDRVGWGLVPFAMFVGLKMNVARHLLIVLLVPDKRGPRNVVAGTALALHLLLPSLIRFNSLLLISTGLLYLVLIFHLSQIGWNVVWDDLRHPGRTIRMLLGRATLTARAEPARIAEAAPR